MSDVPEPILVALQQGLPLCSRPFQEAARALGVSEETLLGHAASLLERGTARRLGGIFDSRRMGFTTALCAVQVEFPKDEGRIAELIEDAHITHCYERGNHEAVAERRHPDVLAA
jgi:siroheme decarboxylase